MYLSIGDLAKLPFYEITALTQVLQHNKSGRFGGSRRRCAFCAGELRDLPDGLAARTNAGLKSFAPDAETTGRRSTMRFGRRRPSAGSVSHHQQDQNHVSSKCRNRRRQWRLATAAPGFRRPHIGDRIGKHPGCPDPLASLQKESPSQPAPSGSQDHFTNSLSQILSAVKAGNLTAAQQALGALQGTSATYGPPSAGASSTSSAGSSVQSAMQALIAAVKSGDTTAAQQALTQLQTAMKAGSGHHYHHQGGASSSASSSTTLSASTSDSVSATGTGASAAASGGDGE